MRGCGRRGRDTASATRASPPSSPCRVPDHHEGRARSCGGGRLPRRGRQSPAALPAAGRRRGGRPRGAARQRGEPAERIREELRDPAAAGPPEELPLLAALSYRLLLPGSALPGRPGRRRPLAPGLSRPGQRPGSAGRGQLAEPAAAARLAVPDPLPQPPLQHRLCLLLPHLLPGRRPARGARRRHDPLVAAGAAPVLLLGGLRGAAVAAARRGARRGAADVPRKAPDGAGVGGSADPAAELPEVAPEPPRCGVLQPGVAGVAQQPPGAAPGARPAAGRHGRGGRLPPGTL